MAAGNKAVTAPIPFVLALVCFIVDLCQVSGDTEGDSATTSDISSLVQSLVDDAAWSHQTNRPTFLFSRASGSGTRTFESNDPPPTLTINYCRFNQRGSTCEGTCPTHKARGLRKIGKEQRRRLRRAPRAKANDDNDDDGQENCPGR